MKYKIIEESYSVDLEREVNKAIKQGWMPLGGMSYSAGYGYGETYTQAMLFGGEE